MDADDVILEKMKEAMPTWKGVDKNIAHKEPLDFSNEKQNWLRYEHPEAIEKVSSECIKRNIPFFMRSAPAIQYLKINRKKFIDNS